MQFKDIIGQNQIKQQLLVTATKGMIAHACIFAGSQGVGKLPLAIAYAQYLNCENPLSSDSCGICRSCLKYNTLAHPDLHFVFPIVKKNKKEVCDDYINDWRTFISEYTYFDLTNWLSYIGADNAQAMIYARESEEIIRKLSLKIYEARYKVMIIWQPEKMNEACANKLLKILEEPQGNTVFILVSDSPDQILPTIQSRCQRINIPKVSQTDIRQALESKFNISETDARQIAHMADGSYIKALEAISVNEDQKLYFNLFVKMMRSSYARNIKDIKTIANELASIGRENQKNFLVYCQRMLREYFINNLNKAEITYLNDDENTFGNRFSPFINERNIIDFTDELSLAALHVEHNVNPKMIFFDLCLKTTMFLKR